MTPLDLEGIVAKMRELGVVEFDGKLRCASGDNEWTRIKLGPAPKAPASAAADTKAFMRQDGTAIDEQELSRALERAGAPVDEPR